MRHAQLVEYFWVSLENLPKDSVIEMNKEDLSWQRGQRIIPSSGWVLFCLFLFFFFLSKRRKGTLCVFQNWHINCLALGCCGFESSNCDQSIVSSNQPLEFRKLHITCSSAFPCHIMRLPCHMMRLFFLQYHIRAFLQEILPYLHCPILFPSPLEDIDQFRCFYPFWD